MDSMKFLGTLLAAVMGMIVAKLFSFAKAAARFMLGSLLGFLSAVRIPKVGGLLPASLLGLLAAAALLALLPKPDLHCTRDFSYKCPLKWDSLSGPYCEAPANYAGPCSIRMPLGLLDAKEKSQQSELCEFKYPCIGDKCEDHGGRDYDALCPAGWTEQPNGLCAPPPSYDGRCQQVCLSTCSTLCYRPARAMTSCNRVNFLQPHNFETYSEKAKEEFSSACSGREEEHNAVYRTGGLLLLFSRHERDRHRNKTHVLDFTIKGFPKGPLLDAPAIE
uniref:CPW-WPC domain-containing protein n=1 Tax=Chromera velia CCMP2878 TaxID=1169474 RepID=A0A0G4GSC4_9ALVE|eukprot:Cvel_23115.t1-p1 / transcript=Cvel_23115.t1 / gene=Cvel_23115 / organism=Chromera_velia_CCMP2878 / gene_product=hypothetical protein / transcript_product=hypothetical protein / location=Cvel_scaffold2347:21627-23671(-) / protein_length=275 / sequence_SO=supercontig / SO=protein_coding / is_pseudo=false